MQCAKQARIRKKGSVTTIPIILVNKIFSIITTMLYINREYLFAFVTFIAYCYNIRSQMKCQMAK